MKAQIIVAAGLLSGCASIPEQCAEEGYTQGTPGFASCVAEHRQSDDAAALLIFGTMGAAGNALQTYGATIQQQQATYQPMRTTDCYQIGQQIQCRTY